uniref:Uncharacterized protein n=1 Tax=Anguilla anguilla TaxID=7936 RepID=A0A0E9QGU0_ANGAN
MIPLRGVKRPGTGPEAPARECPAPHLVPSEQSQ